MLARIAAAFGWKRREARVLVVGLDNSGKTTIINQIKPRKEKSLEVTPTVGFQVEEFSKNNVNFTVFDMSGQSRYRTLWEHYYRDVEAIVFVLDSADRVRMCVVKDELDALLSHKELSSRDVPILFFANKMDLPDALDVVAIVDELALDRIQDQPWHITSTDAISGDGIDEGLSWLVDQATDDRSSKK